VHKLKPKKMLGRNVYEETLDRIRKIYDQFDKVVVSFSGGKDSTAVLNMALIIAKERGALPLEVLFFDEEAIPPPTIDYMERVKNLPEINLHWYCLEFEHRNACSNEEPFWYTWDRDKEDLWVRPLPEGVITTHEKFKKGISFQEFSDNIYNPNDGRIAVLTGIRTQESLRRFRIIASRADENYINSRLKHNVAKCHPIYDWHSNDVWLAVHKFGWDYNTTYDVYNMTRQHGQYNKQRLCPPFGEEPLRGLYVYAECFPEMWEKMLNRVPGVNTAWRYANTELYSSAKTKPGNLNWRQYSEVVLASYPPEIRKEVINQMHKYVKVHYSKTTDPIPEEEANIVSGVSWKFICSVAIRGDFKDRMHSKLISEACNTERKYKKNNK